VSHERRIADEREELVGDRTKQRLVGQELTNHAPLARRLA
jgi:hypothetical protein